MNRCFEILIASPPDREHIVVEIWYGDYMFAELAQEHGALTIEIYPNPTGGPWLLDYEQTIKAMQQAKGKLLGALESST
jgi:hypothetical protein